MKMFSMRTALALLSVVIMSAGCGASGGDNNSNNSNNADDAGVTQDTGGGEGEDAGEDVGEAPTCNVGEEASGEGPVAACDEAGTTACFANSDCAMDERCENIGDEATGEVACCVKGLRGCKGAGELCETEFACEEGVCIGRNDDPNRCSQRCNSNDDCPAEVPECQAFLGLCVTADE